MTNTMMKWLATLPIHHYGIAGETPRPLLRALVQIEATDNDSDVKEKHDDEEVR